MNSSRLYTKRFLAFFVLIMSVYGVLVWQQWLTIFPVNASVVAGMLAVLFLGGLLIVAPGLQKDAENFTLRFLVLTTIQMMGVLFFILGVVFLKLDQAKAMGFQLIAIFGVLLVVQSVLLVKILSKK
jgi:uncharacterized membrane protein